MPKEQMPAPIIIYRILLQESPAISLCTETEPICFLIETSCLLLFFTQDIINNIATIMSRARNTMDHLFSIGELSKYQKISKQTLIFYDKIGLFRPAYADPNNGYRYYSASQIDYLDTILLMKKIGFSLNEIKDHMQHYNIDSSLVALRNQLTVIDRQIQELRLIRNRLLHRCVQMENARLYTEKESPVILEDVPVQHLLVQEVEEPCTLREISIATK